MLEFISFVYLYHHKNIFFLSSIKRITSVTFQLSAKSTKVIHIQLPLKTLMNQPVQKHAANNTGNKTSEFQHHI